MNQMIVRMARHMLQRVIDKHLRRYHWGWQLAGGIAFFLGFGVLVQAVRSMGGL